MFSVVKDVAESPCSGPSRTPNTRELGKFFDFRPITWHISETVYKTRTWLQWKTNGKLCRMAPIPMTLSDFHSHLSCLKPFIHSSMPTHALYTSTVSVRTFHNIAYTPLYTYPTRTVSICSVT